MTMAGDTVRTAAYLALLSSLLTCLMNTVAGFYGGGGVPATAEAKQQQIQSFKKFADMTSKRGADVLLSNHPNQNDAIYNFELMEKCPAGPAGPCCGLATPFIVGSENYVRYWQMNSLCVRVQAAREGQALFI